MKRSCNEAQDGSEQTSLTTGTFGLRISSLMWIARIASNRLASNFGLEIPDTSGASGLMARLAVRGLSILVVLGRSSRDYRKSVSAIVVCLSASVFCSSFKKMHLRVSFSFICKTYSYENSERPETLCCRQLRGALYGQFLRGAERSSLR